MNGESHSPRGRSWPAGQASSGGLAALSRVTFSDSDVGEIFRVATAAVGGLASCQVEASYRSVDGGFVRFPPSQPTHPDIERHRESGWDGQVDVKDGRWGWALPLRHQSTVQGCLVLSAVSAPPENQILLLTILAQQAGAALAYVAMQRARHRLRRAAGKGEHRSGGNESRTRHHGFAVTTANEHARGSERGGGRGNGRAGDRGCAV